MAEEQKPNDQAPPASTPPADEKPPVEDEDTKARKEIHGLWSRIDKNLEKLAAALPTAPAAPAVAQVPAPAAKPDLKPQAKKKGFLDRLW